MPNLRLRKSSKSVKQCDFLPSRYMGSRAASRKIFKTFGVAEGLERGNPDGRLSEYRLAGAVPLIGSTLR